MPLPYHLTSTLQHLFSFKKGHEKVGRISFEKNAKHCNRMASLNGEICVLFVIQPSESILPREIIFQ